MATGSGGKEETPSLFASRAAGHVALPEEQAWNLLALARVQGLGPAGVAALYDRFTNLTQLFHTPADELTRWLRELKIRAADRIAQVLAADRERLLEQSARDLEELKRRGAHLIVDTDPAFPDRLRSIQSPPRWLFAHGDVRLLARQSAVAVVGTREPSREGLRTAYTLANLLAEWGYVTVSGLAEGIDSAAHLGSLDAGGDTIAVLGNGLDIEFPASNRELRQRIVDTGGLVVTEYFPRTVYSRHTFVQRNRIIAGLSGALVPVESKRASGTAHAVAFAEKFGRKVIGVVMGTYNQGNEIAIALESERGILDISSAEGAERLKRELVSFSQDVRPATPSNESVLSRRYATVLRTLREAVARYPIDDDGREWLLEQVKAITAGSHHAG